MEDSIVYSWSTKPGQNSNPLIIAKFSDSEVRSRILNAAFKRPRASGTQSRVFVNPDLTPLQRRQLRELRVEAKRRTENGESVRVQGFKIVPRKK